MASCCTYLVRHVLILMTLVLLLAQSCVETIPIQSEDVSGRLWLRTFDDGKELEGFFAGADGQLLLINERPVNGLFWELHDNILLTWLRTEDQAMLQSVEYYPLRHEEKLVLSQGRQEAPPIYQAETLQEPLSNERYFLTYLEGKGPGDVEKEVSKAYLHLDTGDKTMRGYGGVNNFHGSYERTGVTGYKTGPMVSTMMAGPRMDDELLFMKCLDQSNTILALRKRLFFYQDSRLLCAFMANGTDL